MGPECILNADIKMLPVLLNLGPVVIYSFGLMLFLGIMVGTFLVWKQARRKGLPEEQILDILLLVLFFGMVGGRIGYALTQGAFFASDWSRLFLFARYPGFSFQVGLSVGIITAVVFAKAFKFSPLMVLDLLTVAFSWVAIFAFLGRMLERPVSIFAAGMFMLLGSLFAAMTLSWMVKKINKDPRLASLTRKPGLFFSSYLIFISFLYLIFDAITKGGGLKNYLIIFTSAVIFFIIRYKEVLTMIKFPPNILTQIKSYLEHKNSETEKRLRQLKREDPFEDKSRVLDRAADDTEAQNKVRHERIEAMQKQLNIILVQTRKALTKIKVGKYGVCENCGKMIDTDRLAVMPTATFCIDCEKKKEK